MNHRLSAEDDEVLKLIPDHIKMIICPGIPKRYTSQKGVKPATKKERCMLTRVDHMSIEMIRKLSLRLNHTELNTSQTIMVAGTA